MNVFKGKAETPKVLESFIKSPKSMQQYIIMETSTAKSVTFTAYL